MSDATWFVVDTPEQIIPAGSERMFCMDLVYDGASTAFRDVQSYQGKFGHHLLLLATSKPKAPGTTYDCTDITSMKDMRPFGIPIDLPAGHAYYLPTGTALVAQMHYVNTSTDDLLVKDQLRLRKVPDSEVTTWAAPFITTGSKFTIPPRSADMGKTFDCAIDQDVDLLLLGGHMHEWGSAFKAELGPDTAHLTKQYEVTGWKPDYRDSPPVTLFTENPLHLAKGTVIRTTCNWNNTLDHQLVFPEEMCVTFAVVAGTKEPWVCGLNTEL